MNRSQTTRLYSHLTDLETPISPTSHTRTPLPLAPRPLSIIDDLAISIIEPATAVSETIQPVAIVHAPIAVGLYAIPLSQGVLYRAYVECVVWVVLRVAVEQWFQRWVV